MKPEVTAVPKISLFLNLQFLSGATKETVTHRLRKATHKAFTAAKLNNRPIMRTITKNRLPEFCISMIIY